MKKFLLCTLVITALATSSSMLTGCASPGARTESTTNAAQLQDGVQTITTRFSANAYAPITVQVGIPVVWTVQLDSKALNGCNNALQIPEYQLMKKLTAGETTIEFTPTETGTIPYSCWMGMIKSKIIVVESLSQ